MKSNGFTLVEVLVVIAILGILFGLSVGGVQRYIAKSQQQAYDTLASSSVEATKEYVMNEEMFSEYEPEEKKNIQQEGSLTVF